MIEQSNEIILSFSTLYNFSKLRMYNKHRTIVYHFNKQNSATYTKIVFQRPIQAYHLLWYLQWGINDRGFKGIR